MKLTMPLSLRLALEEFAEKDNDTVIEAVEWLDGSTTSIDELIFVLTPEEYRED